MLKVKFVLTEMHASLLISFHLEIIIIGKGALT